MAIPMRGRMVLLALVLGVLGGMPAALAQEPTNITVNVNYENAAGWILVNGVPIHRFEGGAPEEGMSSPTDAVNVGLWLVNGPNTLAVESKALAEGGRADVTIVSGFGEADLLKETIAGDGRVELAVTGENMPRWGWEDAEAVSGDGADLLETVAALHAAVEAKDTDAFEKAQEASIADLTQVWGPMPDEMRQEMRAFITATPVQPLPADLVATPHLDGRLWVVASPEGMAPIRVVDDQDANMRIETGMYWIKKDGRWQIIR